MNDRIKTGQYYSLVQEIRGLSQIALNLRALVKEEDTGHGINQILRTRYKQIVGTIVVQLEAIEKMQGFARND